MIGAQTNRDLGAQLRRAAMSFCVEALPLANDATCYRLPYSGAAMPF